MIWLDDVTVDITTKTNYNVAELEVKRGYVYADIQQIYNSCPYIFVY